MKLKHLVVAIISSLLLAAGFANAAESFDIVSGHSQVQAIQDGPGSPSCIILN